MVWIDDEQAAARKIAFQQVGQGVEPLFVGEGPPACRDNGDEVVGAHVAGYADEVAPIGEDFAVEGAVVVAFVHDLRDAVERLGVGVEGDAPVELSGDARDAVDPALEAHLELCFRRDEHVDAPQRVERDGAAQHRDLPVDAGDERLGHAAVVDVRQVLPLMQADDDFRGAEFLHRMDQAAGHVDGPAALCFHLDVDGGRHADRFVQHAQPLCACFLALGVVEDHVDRHEWHAPFVGADQGEGHERTDRRRVVQRNHDFLFVLRLRGAGFCVQGEFLGRVLSGERTDDAREENEHHDSVHHFVAHQGLSRGDVEGCAHHHHGQRAGRVPVAQSEHHPARRLVPPEEPLAGPGGQPFRRGGRCQDDQHDPERVPALEEQADVDEHAHADEEVRDEQGVAHEVDAVHQGRGRGDVAVQHEAREESAEDAFEAAQLAERCAEKNDDQHEDVLEHVVGHVVEKAADDGRQGEEHEQAEQDALHRKPNPEDGVARACERARNAGQHEQRTEHGEHRGADADGHADVAREAVARDDGERHEGVRGQNARQEQRSGGRVVEHKVADDIARHAGNHHCGRPEREPPAQVAFQAADVHAQPGCEHDVVEPHLAEDPEARVAPEQPQAVLAHQDSRQHHADDVGDVQAVQQHGRKKDDAEHDEEDPSRIGDGEVVRYVGQQLRHMLSIYLQRKEKVGISSRFAGEKFYFCTAITHIADNHSIRNENERSNRRRQRRRRPRVPSRAGRARLPCR